MNRRLVRLTLIASLSMLGVVAFAPSALATYHDNRIREVHEGGITGDYVELQAFSAGQNQVANTYIHTYDGGGTVHTSTLIPSIVPSGANQATILIAHDGSTPGADVVSAGLNVVNTGGTVCFSHSVTATDPAVDCVAYTSGPTTFPVPAPSPYGAPVVLPGGDLTGSTLIRSISRGCATALDAADDTDNSAADFAVGTGNPRGNAVTPTETVCPPGNPNSPTNPAGKTRKRKCKKKQKSSAQIAKKKKCKKKKKH